MQSWLEDFAYRIRIGPAIFLFAGIICIMIAFGTIGFQTIKAALANPVEALKYE
jgi:putative ABC transport system permease protein